MSPHPYVFAVGGCRQGSRAPTGFVQLEAMVARLTPERLDDPPDRSARHGSPVAPTIECYDVGCLCRPCASLFSGARKGTAGAPFHTAASEVVEPVLTRLTQQKTRIAMPASAPRAWPATATSIA
jgi:hypothetical protein